MHRSGHVLIYIVATYVLTHEGLEDRVRQRCQKIKMNFYSSEMFDSHCMLGKYMTFLLMECFESIH